MDIHLRNLRQAPVSDPIWNFSFFGKNNNFIHLLTMLGFITLIFPLSSIFFFASGLKGRLSSLIHPGRHG